MRNRFNLNESEKNRIRGLHGIQVINEEDVTPMTIQEAVDRWHAFLQYKLGCCPETDKYIFWQNNCPEIPETLITAWRSLDAPSLEADEMEETVTVMNEYVEGGGDYLELERPLFTTIDCVEVESEVNEGPLVDKLLKSQGITDINEQTKTGDQVAAETEALQGIALNMLNPITQQYLSKGTTMNVYQIMMMLAGCHEDNEKSPYSILSPMQLSSSSNDNPMVSFDNKKFCLIYKNGGAVCFDNVCKLGPNSSSWTQHKNWRYVQSDLVPALKKYMKGSTIDNGYAWQDDDTTSDNYLTGGEMLRWTTTDDSINAKWKLNKATT